MTALFVLAAFLLAVGLAYLVTYVNTRRDEEFPVFEAARRENLERETTASQSWRETETVECGQCDGCGTVNWMDDLFGDERFGTCLTCGGTGTVEVCANCYDDWEGCSVCNPTPVTTATQSSRESGEA